MVFNSEKKFYRFFFIFKFTYFLFAFVHISIVKYGIYAHFKVLNFVVHTVYLIGKHYF